ncbi:hypothetical protein A3K72_03220, partial [Candidatus Woesearchaeota archaeon RBG_13_36_6]
MRSYEIKIGLLKKLNKISKRDKNLYEQILKKIDEVIHNKNIDHYKNLKYQMKEFKRVHIKKSFVLLFEYMEANDKVVFT